MRPACYVRITLLVLALLSSLEAKAQIDVNFNVTTTPGLDVPWEGPVTVNVQASYPAGIDRLDIQIDWVTIRSYPYTNNPQSVSEQYAFNTQDVRPGQHWLGIKAVSENGSDGYYSRFTVRRCVTVSPGGQPFFTEVAGYPVTGSQPLREPFVARWQVRPRQAGSDAVMGISGPPATGPAGLAAILRFNNGNVIDAFNGITNWYMAETPLSYSTQPVPPSTDPPTYDVTMEVNPVTQRYSAAVREPSGNEALIAERYRFRSYQSEIINWTAWAGAGELESCFLGMHPWFDDKQWPLGDQNVITGLAADPVGRMYVLAAPDRVYVFRADGSEVPFQLQLQGTGLATLNRIAIDDDGNIYVAGTNGLYSPPQERLLLIKFNSRGERLWVRNLPGLTPGHHYVPAALEVRGGRVVVVPHTTSFGPWQLLETIPVFWLDSNGNPIGPGPVRLSAYNAYSAAIDGRGNAYITVSDREYLLWKKHFVVKVNAMGQEVWRRSFSSSPALRWSYLAVDGTNHVYVAGDEAPNSRLAKFDAAGRFLWRKPVGAGDTTAAPTAMTTDGSNIYLTGTTSSGAFFSRFRSDGWQVYDPYFSWSYENVALKVVAEKVFVASMQRSRPNAYLWHRAP